MSFYLSLDVLLFFTASLVYSEEVILSMKTSYVGLTVYSITGIQDNSIFFFVVMKCLSY